MIRTGLGLDVHGFGGVPPVILLGVVVDEERGLAGHSDGDAAAHAVADALLGAAGQGDIGMRFPSSDDRWKNADSMAMLATVVDEVRSGGASISHIDVTIVAQTVRISPARDAMIANLERLVAPGTVSVKATTTDRLGAIGRDEGIAAYAIATVSYDA